MLCSKVASLVSHILLCGLYMRHYTCANTDRILYKILKNNASNSDTRVHCSSIVFHSSLYQEYSEHHKELIYL